MYELLSSPMPSIRYAHLFIFNLIVPTILDALKIFPSNSSFGSNCVIENNVHATTCWCLSCKTSYEGTEDMPSKIQSLEILNSASKLNLDERQCRLKVYTTRITAVIISGH
jgi:hypothetical protein